MAKEGISCCDMCPGLEAGPPGFQFQFCYPEGCIPLGFLYLEGLHSLRTHARSSGPL